MADIDTLRPEVREALEVCDRDLPQTWRSQTTQWGVIRAELPRLAEYEQAAGRLAVEKAEFRQRAEKAEAELAAALKANRDCVDHFEQMQAELAAMKARMRPVARVENGEVRALMDPADEGKYVAVVVVEE